MKKKLFFNPLLFCTILVSFLNIGCSASTQDAVPQELSSTASPNAPPASPYQPKPSEGLQDMQSEGMSRDIDILKISSPTPSPIPYETPPRRQACGNSLQVRGVYVSAWNMNGKGYKRIMRLLDQTDLNAMVIDVKNDTGRVTYPTAIKQAQELNAGTSVIIPNLQEKLKDLKSRNIYTIARIVVFKDPLLAAQVPDYAIHRKNGGIWKDPKGVAWVDPYHEEVWKYNIAVAKEAAAMGFDEIQFDYVRFPENEAQVDREVQYRSTTLSKEQAIETFLGRVGEEIKDVCISADVFGLTTSSKNDMGIGQKWERLAPILDVISPMTYPSHYAKGTYGAANPDMQPYTIISGAMKDAVAKNKALSARGEGTRPARIRPWYQDFTATWVKPHQVYGSQQVQEQIKAGRDHGIEEFLLWNPSGKYTYP